MTPNDLMNETLACVPTSVWRTIDKIVARNHQLRKPAWPDYVFLPTQEWIKASKYIKEPKEAVPFCFSHDFQAFGTWRLTQDIIRFHPKVFDALINSSVDGKIPVDVLHRMPAYSIYIEAPLTVLKEKTIGFFAQLVYDTVREIESLTLFFIMPKHEGLFPITLQLTGCETIEKMLSATIDGVMNTLAEKFHATVNLNTPLLQELKKMYVDVEGVSAALSLLLYVCVYGLKRDANLNVVERANIEYPRPKKTKRGWRLAPALKPTEWILGEKIGEEIKKATREPSAHKEVGTHASPRPHIRRAHWHSFWVGTKVPKEGVEPKPRELLAKWLPPIPVAMGEDENPQED